MLNKFINIFNWITFYGYEIRGKAGGSRVEVNAYGRIIRGADGGVEAIVEFKAATEAQRAIREINPSYYLFRTVDLFDALTRVTNQNASGEYYITDVFELLLKDGKRRAYSIASAPSLERPLELHIRHLPGGLFTDHVFGAMKERDILRFEGPLGTFYLRETSEKPAIGPAACTAIRCQIRNRL